jgi:NodT family efflux transporter outer membrane factor (OMF) lipoprotein
MRSGALLPLLLLGACTVGPDYRAPDVVSPSSFTQAAGQAPLSRAVPEKADVAQWWTGFGDKTLDSLIARALAANLDLKTAASRLRQAREEAIMAGAAEWPQVNATGSAARVHSNANLASRLGPPQGGSGAPRGGTDIKLYSAGFDATWELDIFGGTRRQIEAAKANSEAALWQLHDGEVSLTAEIASTYFTLRAAQARLAVLTSEAARQNDTLTLVASRRQAGFVTQYDVDQQNVLLATTNAEIAPLQAEAAISEHALAVLLAEPPEALYAELGAPAPLPPVPVTVPTGLPSDLLRRRPDVRAAERRLAAATANVGVAVADLYPKFNLIGALSFSGNGVSNLFSSGNLGEMGYGGITWSIFSAGKIHANIRSKEEYRNQAYFAYQKAVLGAIRDAEDALARYRTDQQRLIALERAAASGRSSVEIASQQYRAGLAPYLNVLSAEANYLSVSDQLVQSRQALVTDLVALYKALGGGWSDSGA